MAVMQALLKIKADVIGEEGVQKLGRALGGLNDTAGRVSGGLRGMLSAAGGLSGVLGSLAPVVSGVGLAAMAQNAINAADDMNDLAQKTGVSVEQLSRFKQAADMSGTSIEAVGGAMVKLSRNISASLGQAADEAGESAAEIRERTKRELDRQVDDVKNAADRQVDAIKEGERRQLDAVKDNADKRIAAIERESDARLDELNRRYRQEEKLLNDRYDDEADRLEEAADKRQRAEERAIEDRYEAQLEAIQEQENLDKKVKADRLKALRQAQADELEAVRDRYQEEAKLRGRALRDQEDAAREAIDKRRKAEEGALKAGFDQQKEIVQQSTEAQTQAISKAASANAEAVKAGAEASIAALKSQAAAASGLSEDMAELGLSGKGASAAFAELGIALRNTDGTVRSTDQVMLDVADRFQDMPDGVKKTTLALQIFGKSGAALIPMLNGGRESIERLQATMGTDFAQSADAFNDKTVTMQTQLTMLSVSIASALLPALGKVTDIVVSLAEGFNGLGPEMQNLILAGAAIAIAWGPLSAIFGTLLGTLQALAGLKLGATIAGWLGIVGPVMAGIQAAAAGVLAWMTGTFLPGLIAIFSGPVGWTVLAVAAVVAMVALFRKPIMEFFAWLGGAIAQGVQAIWEWGEPIRSFWVDVWNSVATAVTNAFNIIKGIVSWALQAIYAIAWQLLVQPWINLWENVLRGPVTALWEWMKGAWTEALNFVSTLAYQLLVQPWINLWENVLREPVTALWDWLKGVWGEITKFWQEKIATPIQKAWEYLTTKLQQGMQKAVDFVRGIWNGMIKGIRGVINGFLAGWSNAINSAINGVNRLIAAFNRLPGPDIGLIPNMSVPQFAEGGVVNRPTLAMVGEGGEREYIIPESKMAGAAAAYLGGARGGAVLGGAAPINITTGPVMQQGGQNYVSMADLQRAMRATEAATLARIRTPAGRSALGIR